MIIKDEDRSKSASDAASGNSVKLEKFPEKALGYGFEP
jgi:hypothetical protein